jgi:hypothetical protein
VVIRRTDRRRARKDRVRALEAERQRAMERERANQLEQEKQEPGRWEARWGEETAVAVTMVMERPNLKRREPEQRAPNRYPPHSTQNQHCCKGNWRSEGTRRTWKP